MKTSGFKINKIIIFTLIIMFLLIVKVEASTCNSTIKNKLVFDIS